MNDLHSVIALTAKGLDPSCIREKTSETECTMTLKFSGNKIEQANKLRAFFGNSIVYDDIYFCPNINRTTAYFITFDAL